MITYVSVPAASLFAGNVGCLDLETVKVTITDGHVMANGETLRQRWSVAMCAFAMKGEIAFVYGDSEAERLRDIGYLLSRVTTVVYSATREFDEMIVKGRFTNARRAHEEEPFFPFVPEAERVNWRNLGTGLYDLPERQADMASRDIPAAIHRGFKSDLEHVAVHLLRDVADLIGLTVRSAPARDWHKKVASSYSYARGFIPDDLRSRG
jgi:hypothetical protein